MTNNTLVKGRKNIIKILKKTLWINIALAIIFSTSLYIYKIYNKKFEYVIKMKLSNKIILVYDLNSENHSEEIFYIIESLRNSGSLVNSSLLFEKHKLRKGAKISYKEGFSNLFIENRFHGINYDTQIVEPFFEGMKSELMLRYKKNLKLYLNQILDSVVFYENQFFDKKLESKYLISRKTQIEGITKILSEPANFEVSHYLISKEKNSILPSIVLFFFSLIIFSFSVSIFYIGKFSITKPR